MTAAGLSGVTPHDLRATHASWVIDEGGSVMDAAARLGHAAGTVTTRHYARPVLGRDSEIADRLDQTAGTGADRRPAPDRWRKTARQRTTALGGDLRPDPPCL